MDDITSKPEIHSTKAKISQEERARRQAAVDYARGSVRLEGFILSSSVEEMNRRYVDGEFTSKELTDAILAHCKP